MFMEVCTRECELMLLPLVVWLTYIEQVFEREVRRWYARGCINVSAGDVRGV